MKNTESIEVTPEMLRAAQLNSELGSYAAANLCGAYDLLIECYQVMHAAQPAEQRQGEPVALPDRKEVVEEWATPGGPYRAEGWNACLDEVAKLGPLYTHPAPAVQQEPFAWLVQSPQDLEFVEGVAHTKEDADRYTAMGWSSTPMFSHADPGEVERLRTELEEWKKRCQYNADTAHDVASERDTLRAKLAERDALLQEIRGQSCSIWLRGETQHKMDATLSASAEPSVPYGQQCPGDGVSKCKACPSAPAELDERAEFEAHMRRDFPGVYLTRTLDRESYRNPSHQGSWLSWQARAALERKP